METATSFLIGRISEEAERSGAPLDEDEAHFLSHLPDKPTNPTAEWGSNASYEGDSRIPILRDLGFERLCNLAKAAYSNDIRTRPHGAREWAFAAAVLKAHRQPLSWLLQWAGIRPAKRRARGDRLLLVGTATLVVTTFIIGAVTLAPFTFGQSDARKWTLFILGGCVDSGFLILFYFGVRRLEARLQERNIEKYRCDLPVRSSTSTRR